MIVKTIFVIKHAFGPFEVDSIGPVSETTNDIRAVRIITGSTNNSLLKAGDADGLGCVTWGTASPANLGQGSGRYSALMNINASKSNAIFGASSTVQPAGLYAQFLIRYS